MKLLLVAPLPPPHHGLSILIQQWKEACEDATVTTLEKENVNYTFIDSAISRELNEIGFFSLAKIKRLALLAWHIVQARWRLGRCSLYYIPATGHATQILRDCLLLALLRPFFTHLILHWHGLGLKSYLDRKPFLIRAAVRLFLGRHDLSLILHGTYVQEVEWLNPKAIRVIPNGIPDPCPDFESVLGPLRQATFQARQVSLLHEKKQPLTSVVYRVLFMAHCTREKGLSDAVEAIVLANALLEKEESPLRLHLSIAGQFPSEIEKKEFFQYLSQKRLQPETVAYAGFLQGSEKDHLLRNSDCLCFPSFYPTEALPVSLIEAFAYGLNLVVSDWRALSACLPPGSGQVAPIQDPVKLAQALLKSAESLEARASRRHFLENHTFAIMMQELRKAFAGLK